MNNEWYTPTYIIEAAKEVMGGIDLDPASCDLANDSVGAERYFTEKDNGLDKEWFGRVWLNPPYSMPLIKQFVDKLILEWNAGNIDEACVLTNNATDTSWFHKLIESDGVVCLTKGRIRFSSPKNSGISPRQGQAIFYFGDNSIEFAKEFAKFGTILLSGA